MSIQGAVGVAIVLANIVLLVLVKYCVVAPVMMPRQDGSYGELYGPVSVLRWAIYGLFLLEMGVGVLLVLVYGMTQGPKSLGP